MGLLEGLGDNADVVELEMLALIGETLIGPGGQYHVQRFLEAFAALSVGYAVAFVGPSKPAASHTKLDAAVADMVEGGDFLGNPDGVCQGQHVD